MIRISKSPIQSIFLLMLLFSTNAFSQNAAYFGTWLAAAPGKNYDRADGLNEELYIRVSAGTKADKDHDLLILEADSLFELRATFSQGVSPSVSAYELKWQYLAENQSLATIERSDFPFAMGLRMVLDADKLMFYRTSLNAMPLVFELGKGCLKDAKFSESLLTDLEKFWKHRKNKNLTFELRYSKAERKSLGPKKVAEIWESRIHLAKELLSKQGLNIENVKIKKGPKTDHTGGQLWIW